MGRDWAEVHHEMKARDLAPELFGESAPDPERHTAQLRARIDELTEQLEHERAENARLNEIYSCVTTIRVDGPAGGAVIQRLPGDQIEYAVFRSMDTGGDMDRMERENHTMLIDAWRAAKRIAGIGEDTNAA